MGSTFEELSKAVTGVVEVVSPSVVGVGAGGSGVVLADGLVATNAHNLRDQEVVVTFADGRRAQAAVTGVDADGDLAVLSVDTAGAAPAKWGAPTPRLGEAVLAFASPGGRGLRVGVGFVAATDVPFRGPGGRRIAGAIQHTAPLERGSSGGPLTDGEGRLVGIDTHRLGDGLYLALPADGELRSRLDALARGESRRRARLGVALAPPKVARRLRRSVGLPERDGLLVHAVEPGGPADRAGVREGDLIISVGGAPVTSADELAASLETGEAGGSVDLGLVRGVDEVSVAVDLTGTASADEGSV
ncbi:MAG TPA: trypsin-like peptidase domain-containing protein [Acidimicrobiales bacterium]|nr:trypsin-like peptidase domain-containing protein [Acidimicrobiales bacterium]